jgi:acetolactate synthase-1/2/3 large subunit
MFQPDFIKIAEAMGINGIRVSDKTQVDASIEAALAHPGAVLLDFEVEDVEDCYPMMPPGVSLSQTIDQPKVEPTRQPERVR